LLLATDIVAIWAGFACALAFDVAAPARSSLIPPFGMQTAVFGACQIIGLLSMGLYRVRQRPTVRDKILRILFAVFGATILCLGLVWAWPALGPSSTTLLLAALFAAAALVALRVPMMRIIDMNPIKRRVLVVGSGKLAHKIRRLRRRADRRRFELLGFVADTDADRREAARLEITPVLTVAEARNLLPHVDEVVVALDDRRGAMPVDLLFEAKQIGVRIADVIQFLERETERLDLDLLQPAWILYQKSSQTNALYRFVKRVFDMAFSVLLLTLTSPLLLVSSLAILIEDGSGKPLMYRQSRVGRHGQVFQLLKFRSMRVDAERDGPQWARQDGDDRETRVGRILRRFRLDELPQLWNVLRGDMSIVGPRPALLDEITAYDDWHRDRLRVKPGITGLWQISYARELKFEEMVLLDVDYIENWSLLQDLTIVLRTVPYLLTNRGAY